ncbi:MAG TPA: sigma-70 family RNA polymerase sigma factor [Candidatus Nitrosocosmicus sp.]|nr:sigma-70 family RNA polymerase sigma factor [Candidatus Nitrosocosmicus sp.]
MSNEAELKQRRKLYQPTWETICLESYERLTGFAKYVWSNDANAILRRTYEPEDFVNATVERILFYSVNPESIKNKWAYLKQALKNLVIDLGKQVMLMPMDYIDDEDFSEDNLPVEQPSMWTDAENKDLQKILKQTTNDLNSTEKEIFKLFLDGYSCHETAEIMGRDINFIRYQLNATRAKIRYRVEKLTKTARP